MIQGRKPHYENGTLKKILFDGGYVDMIGDSPVYMFFIKDHLGSVRAVVSETGEVLQTNEFYPYGDLFSTAGTAGSNGNRYRFTGKELGEETGLYDFSARLLQTSLGRFTTIDPLAEKYPNISPYAYCNGNPVNFVDIDGRFPFATNLIGGLASVAVEYVSQVVDNCISNRNFDVSNFTNVDIANLGVAFVEGFVTSGTNIVKKATVKTIVGVSGSILSNTVDIKIDNNGLNAEVNGYLEVAYNTTLDFAVGSVKTDVKVSPFKSKSANKGIKEARSKAKSNGNSFDGNDAKKSGMKTRQSNATKKTLNEISSESTDAIIKAGVISIFDYKEDK